MRRVSLVAVALALATAVSVTAAGPARDHASIARNVLPPGETGGVVFDAHATDQLKTYDALTPLFDRVTAADVNRSFKPETLWTGGEKAVRVERPRPGAVVKRDEWDVPHIFGKSQQDVSFALGWVSAEDRGLLMELARGPARISAIDAPGLDAFGLALSGKQFLPSAQTEAFLAAQLPLLSKQELANVKAFVAGVNAQRRATNTPGIAPWTPNDVVAMATLIGARFGAGGGDETRRAMFLSALEKRFGDPKAHDVWNDLREQQDPETPVSVPGTFPWGAVAESESGNAIVDDGSFKFVSTGGVPAAFRLPASMSNALLVSGSRSTTGHPLMVAGPQVGYFYPQFFFEADLHGGGFDARGVVLPGLPYVLLGRGADYAWSATSSNSDNIDTFAETLCGDDFHYVFKGECRAMGTFDAGVLKSPGSEEKLAFRTTVHGPVFGYATAGGKRVALSLQRSTRGRELRSAKALNALDTGVVRSARDFVRLMSGFEFSFNWFYADWRDIATVSSGRLPIRAPGVEAGLPTIGTGDDEWRGFVAALKHPWAISPPSGAILNWNNKPALGWGAADDEWAFGSVHRVDLLVRGAGAKKVHSPASLVAAMNAAATQDLRVVEVLPVIEAVLKGGQAPSLRAQRMLDLLESWRAAGGSRLDRDLDGRIDDPAAAIMDAVWPKWADTVMSPVLGPLTDRLAQLMRRSDDPNSNGSAFGAGWYGYVDKDLRSLLGQPVQGAFHERYCGAGDLAACRTSLWAALDAAGAELEAKQGADPLAWRADATAERIRFAPGLMPETMRWANRPTFQQVISFRSHR